MVFNRKGSPVKNCLEIDQDDADGVRLHCCTNKILSVKLSIDRPTLDDLRHCMSELFSSERAIWHHFCTAFNNCRKTGAIPASITKTVLTDAD